MIDVHDDLDELITLAVKLYKRLMPELPSGGLPGEQRAVWWGSSSEGLQAREGTSAAPVLALTSVKQPLLWSPCSR